MFTTNKYDAIQWIGNKVCAAGTEATRMLVDQPACTAGEAWNMGVLTVCGIIGLLALIVFVQRRKAHRDDYMR